ncbi:PAAR domain-containing protein [Azonexus sp.]|jgi:uncharacterized Zn-binding protein involved in type VI secretion|uniref:PAAR domain-containing protein n=1 Tax=Azonexus sp. TaxID=1872668 RepID=UPI00283501D3|nr:PAAR domain-containing protein [Azonexus sp.]MDR1995538.1 PAAR domain-containing protein [Azonexus sp.]
MFRRIIREGDTTTHGGKVINGSDRHRLEGRRIARLGDEVDCPAKYPGGTPHGVNKIIEGATDELLDGIPIALEGHKTECGCALIGSIDANVG